MEGLHYLKSNLYALMELTGNIFFVCHQHWWCLDTRSRVRCRYNERQQRCLRSRNNMISALDRRQTTRRRKCSVCPTKTSARLPGPIPTIKKKLLLIFHSNL